MERTEEYEIVQVGRPALGPEPKVVGVDPSSMVAAGEAAALVAVAELSHQPTGNGSSASPDPDRHTMRVFEDQLGPRVTEETLDGFDRNAGSVFDLPRPVLGSQCFGGDVAPSACHNSCWS